MVVRDDVILAALVERSLAGRQGFHLAQIRTAAVEHAQRQVDQVGRRHRDGIGDSGYSLQRHTI